MARARSFSHAVRGIRVIVATQDNFLVHLMAVATVAGLGMWCRIASGEWLALVLAITAVLVAEAVNTAIEIDIDLTSPEYHPYARDTKDVAAGAVLLAVIGAIVVGLIIFVPKL